MESKNKSYAKELFEVVGSKYKQNYDSSRKQWVDVPDENEVTILLDKDSLEYYQRTKRYFLVREAKPLGRVWPGNAEISVTDSRSSRCYSQVHYKVTSETQLSERDFEILRAQGAFMAGQVTGAHDEGRQEGDFWVYGAYSVCDSGD